MKKSEIIESLERENVELTRALLEARGMEWSGENLVAIDKEIEGRIAAREEALHDAFMQARCRVAGMTLA